MEPDKLVKNARQLAAPLRVTTGKTFGLKNCEPGATLRFDKKDENRAKEALAQGVQTLPLLQNKLYAQDQRAKTPRRKNSSPGSSAAAATGPYFRRRRRTWAPRPAAARTSNA